LPWVLVFFLVDLGCSYVRFTFAARFRLTDRTSLLKLFCWAAAGLGNQ
jgi:hypothetical protein